MKTINFELSKRLNDLGLLENIETDFCFSSYKGENDFILLGYKYGTEGYDGDEYDMYKTLTLEEAIEILPNKIEYYYFVFGKNENGYWCNYLEKDECELYILDRNLLNHIYSKETPLAAIEKLLEYLLDNNLLGKQ